MVPSPARGRGDHAYPATWHAPIDVMKILVLNAGSSSQKSCLFEIEGGELPLRQPKPLWEAHLDRDQLEVSTSAGAHLEETLSPEASSDPLSRLLQTLWSGPTAVLSSPSEIDIVGHRVVHGGREYSGPTRVDEATKAVIDRLSVLAPLHNPAVLRGIEAIEKLLSDTPQIAVFDTAFHSSIPEAAAIYPGPYAWTEQGIRRFGFHGINHENCAQRAAAILGRELDSLRLISCHLGNGCSLAAIKGGRSVDTTMGFTPMEGVMMGTRSGSIDPGLMLHLMRENGWDAVHMDHLLNHESGLKGVSGISSDMREIDAAVARGDERARLALDIYIHRLRSYTGAMLASLGGLDALIFTAGVGEHSPTVRAGVAEAFRFLGLEIDPASNQNCEPDTDIATLQSAVRVLVLQAQEDWAIARECWKLRCR